MARFIFDVLAVDWTNAYWDVETLTSQGLLESPLTTLPLVLQPDTAVCDHCWAH